MGRTGNLELIQRDDKQRNGVGSQMGKKIHQRAISKICYKEVMNVMKTENRKAIGTFGVYIKNKIVFM